MKMRKNVFLTMLIFVMIFGLVSCSKKKESKAENENSYARRIGPSKQELLRTKIYLESVPSGTEVCLLQEDENSGEGEKLLGKTPLVLKPSDCPGMTFWIKMDMEEYLKKVKIIPDMNDWITGFKSDRYFGYPRPVTSQEYFNYEVSLSRNVTAFQGGLVATGPEYKLDWPRHNRICVLFVPKKKKISLFYPLMPPPGTFERVKGSWPSDLRNQYRFSKEQAEEAIECLTRCGKYRARVKDPFKKDTAREYSITVQGPGNDLIVIQTTEIRIIPGYND